MSDKEGWRDALTDPPAETCWVLVYGDGAMATRAWNANKQKWEDWELCKAPGLVLSAITHWRPLPEAPRPETEIGEPQ